MTNSANIMLLDCTLRDGGYVNNWEFETADAIKIRDYLYESGVRYIELGLMAESSVKGKQTKFASFEEVKPLLEDRKADCHYCVMMTQAEYDKCKFDVPMCCNETVDIIRLAFFKPEVSDAIKTAEMLMDKGYSVFLQAMATSMYDDQELEALISCINRINPTSFYMVDSFSTMYNDDVEKMERFILDRLNDNIIFGFHAHNNIQMAYSNAITFMKFETKRPLMVDGSIYGMGRGAGNVPIELLMEFINKNLYGKYIIKEIMGAFESVIKPIFDRFYWGYSMPYFLTAINDINSVYGWYLDRKGITSLMDISDILERIPMECKYTLMKTQIDEIISEYKEK